MPAAAGTLSVTTESSFWSTSTTVLRRRTNRHFSENVVDAAAATLSGWNDEVYDVERSTVVVEDGVGLQKMDRFNAHARRDKKRSHF